MSFVGGGWRSGTATDAAVNTGSAPTTTVTVISPTTWIKGASITLTVTGTGFDANTKIYGNYNPCATIFDSVTQLRCTSFNTTPDSGTTIVIGTVKPGEKISTVTKTFTAT